MPVYTVETELDKLHWEMATRIRERLHRGEQIKGCWKTWYRGGRESGLVLAYVVTNRQVIVAGIRPFRSFFYDPRVHSGASTMLLQEVAQIVEDNRNPRVARLIVRGTRGNTLGMEFGSGPACGIFKATLQAAMAELKNLNHLEPLPPLPATAADTKPDIANQLTQLGELYKQGILTKDEYQLAKSKVLGR